MLTLDYAVSMSSFFRLFRLRMNVWVCRQNWNPLRTRAIPEHFCGCDSLRRGAISSVCTFTFTFYSFDRHVESRNWRIPELPEIHPNIHYTSGHFDVTRWSCTGRMCVTVTGWITVANSFHNLVDISNISVKTSVYFFKKFPLFCFGRFVYKQSWT